MKKLEPTPPFDFIFIDADKPSNTIYFTEAKRLVKKGGVIVSFQLPRLEFSLELGAHFVWMRDKQKDCG